MRWWDLQQLKSRNVKARLSAANRVGTEGDTVFVAPLVQLLADPAAQVRGAAAEALGRIKEEQSVPALSSKLAKETDGEVRRAMVKALQDIGSAKAIPALVPVLGDPMGEVGWQAAKALQTLRWEPSSDTERAAWHLAVSQFEDAASFGAAAIEPLAKLARGVQFHRSIRAVETLAKIGGAQAVKPLLDCLSNNDFTVRAAAATALGEVGDARAVDPLVRTLRDAHHQVCLAACISLGKMGDQRAVEPLVSVLKHSAPDVRAAAVTALGKLRDARAVEPLVQKLQDPDLEVREAAATALGMIGDEKAIEFLALSLIDSHSAVRQAAANSLRRIEPYWERSEAAFRAIPNLQAALGSKEYWVRHSAADVLKKLGISESHETRMPLDSDGALKKRQAAQTVVKAMLRDSDPEFRQAAAEGMGRIGLADSIPTLVERLSDTERGVRAAAARSLEMLRWQPANPADKARQLVALEKWSEAAALGPSAAEELGLVLARRETRLRKHAVEALVRIGGPKAISALRAHASDPSRAIRDEVTAALAALEGASGRERSDIWGEPANRT
jgi:HEAT repeat protein